MINSQSWIPATNWRSSATTAGTVAITMLLSDMRIQQPHGTLVNFRETRVPSPLLFVVKMCSIKAKTNVLWQSRVWWSSETFWTQRVSLYIICGNVIKQIWVWNPTPKIMLSVCKQSHLDTVFLCMYVYVYITLPLWSSQHTCTTTCIHSPMVNYQLLSWLNWPLFSALQSARIGSARRSSQQGDWVDQLPGPQCMAKTIPI